MPESAPLKKDTKLLTDLENQRTIHAGVLSGPSFRDVKTTDLSHLRCMEALFWQAVDQGVLKDSEMEALNFLGASVRARSARAGDPVRVFVGIVRRGLWSHITCEEEERARTALMRYRESVPSAFRLRPAPGRGETSARQGSPSLTTNHT